MPTHINQFRGRPDPQYALAIAAISHLKAGGVIHETDGMISVIRKASAGYDHERLLDGKNLVVLSEMRQSKKQIDALRAFLHRNGWKRIAVNTYARGE
jgi:hypothetical protein